MSQREQKLQAAVEAFLRAWKQAGPEGAPQLERFAAAVRLAEEALDMPVESPASSCATNQLPST